MTRHVDEARKPKSVCDEWGAKKTGSQKAGHVKSPLKQESLTRFICFIPTGCLQILS